MITLDELLSAYEKKSRPGNYRENYSPRSPIPTTTGLILHCSDWTVPETLSSQPHLLLMLLTAGESEITLSASNMTSTRDII